MKMTAVCPECKKGIPVNSVRGKTAFCSMMCERNYRYRMRHMDPVTGTFPTPERAKKL